MGADGKSVAVAFAIQIGLAIVVFVAFSWLRLTGWTRRFYAPKRFDPSVEHKPRRLPPGFFKWMGTIYTYPEDEVIKVAGLDSAMYLRVLSFGWEVFIWVSLWSLIILVPIHTTGNRIDRLLTTQNQVSPPPPPPQPVGCIGIGGDSEVQAKKYEFSTFDKVSLANLEAGTKFFWAHCVLVYIITFVVLKILWRYNKEATLLRLAFVANAPRGGPSHTVLITDIPGMRYGTVVWYLRSLVGSTLFVMLPGPLKRKILDFVENSMERVTSTVDIAGVVGPKAKRASETSAGRRTASDPGEAEAVKQPPPVMDAMAKAADYNAAVAAEKEKERMKKDSGVIMKRGENQLIEPSDPSLDPWVQAAAVLGDINEPKADKVKEFIHQEIESTYGKGVVAAVNPVWDQNELNPLVNEYIKVRQKLEDYLDNCAYHLKRRKPMKRLQVTVVPATMGAWGMERYGLKPVKVDALTFWSTRLDYLVNMIEASQARCLQKPIPAAFVTVETRATQVHIANTLHHHDETTWQMHGAPEPKSVIWGSLPMRRWERSLRTVVLWGAYVVLLLFYLIPIAAVQGLIEVPRLATVPVLGTIVNLPFIKQILVAIIPGLVLLIFLALLPSLLALMCRLSGFVSSGEVDFGVVTRYFYFQVVALFLGSMIAGSLLGQLKQFISNPQSIISILGVAIPNTATFFINYILVAGIGKTGIKHLRVSGFVIFWILSRFASTPRARARLWADQYTTYGPNVPTYTIAFLLGLVYCLVNPIIAPVVLIYFSFSLISERYNNLYVFKREYESGGRLWLYVFNQFVIALYFMQVIMIILLAINKFPVVPILIPAPIITFGFHLTCLHLFKRPWQTMSSHDAAFLDHMDQVDRGGTEVSNEELALIQDMYLSPAFKIKREDVVDLLREAHITDRRINGEVLEDIEASMEDEGYVTPAEDDDSDGIKPAATQLNSLADSPASSQPLKWQYTYDNSGRIVAKPGKAAGTK